MRHAADLLSVEPTSFDKKIFAEYPQPIASAWSRVFSAKDEAARLQQAHISFFEVLARTLTCYFLPDYLRGEPPDDDVEKSLAKGLEKGALGSWWQLLRLLIRANGSRPKPFFIHAYPWYFNTGEKPSESARLIESLVESRNTMSHGVQSLSTATIHDSLSEALSRYRRLLASLSWLCGYPLFRAEIGDEALGRGKTGHVQILRGSQPRPPYEKASWRASLSSKAVYVHHPEDGALMLSPLAQIIDTPDGPRLHILSRADKTGALTLSFDDSPPISANYEGSPVTITQILGHRTSFPWVQANEPQGALCTKIEPHIAPYEIRGSLPAGAAGRAYRVWDPRTNRELALEVLRPIAAASEQLRERFLERARRTESSTHEHILKVEVNEDAEIGPFLITEVMPRLDTAMAFSESDFLRLTVQMLDALAHLHENGTTHGDIRPSAIFLRGPGDAVLGGFGLATDALDDFASRLVAKLQTQDYSSPEQQRGRLTAKSDVFSLARVLHELKVGHPSDDSPGTNIEGWLGELLRSMGEHFPGKRLESRQALELVRSKLPEPRVAEFHGIPQAHQLGRDLRTILESGARLPIHLTRHLDDCRAPGGQTGFDLWTNIRGRHLRIAWPHLVDALSLGDVLSATGVHFSAEHVFSAARNLPLDEEQRAALFESYSLPADHSRRMEVYRNIPAAALGLVRLVECLGQATQHSVDERKFLENLLQSFGDAEVNPLEPMPVLWQRLVTSMPSPAYRRVATAKKSGKLRWLNIPEPKLAAVQGRIGQIISRYLPEEAACTGFIPQRSTALHARFHEGAAAAVVVDIHDFFGSVTFKQVSEAFNTAGGRYSWRWKHPFEGWDQHSVSILCGLSVMSHLTRHNAFLPQGSPSSPAIANFVALKLDAFVKSSIASEHGASDWTYSRYADDLVISSRSGGHLFHERAQKVLFRAVQRMGWVISQNKIRHWSSLRGGPLALCGILVPGKRGGRLELPRETKRRIRAALHASHNGTLTASGRGILGYGYSILGKHALATALPGTAQRSLRELARTIAQDSTNEFLEGWLDE